jgi:hypothetical protein
MNDDYVTISRALDFIKAGDKENARKILEALVKDEPANEQAWYLLAHLVPAHQAKACFEQVVKLNPQNQKARSQLQKLCMEPTSNANDPSLRKEKAKDLILYGLLGGIILILLAIGLLQGGLLLQLNSPQAVPTPVVVQSESKPTPDKIPNWEYLSVVAFCSSEPDFSVNKSPIYLTCADAVYLEYRESGEGPNEHYSKNLDFQFIDDYLSYYGKDGWELINIIPGEFIFQTSTFIFKRPTY